MKKILFTFRNALMALLIMGAASAEAQSTLNVAGNSAKINGMTFDYSIGEMTLVSTERNANIIVTQGYCNPPRFPHQVTPATAFPALNWMI